ncbi:MAG: hypothetical protein CME19_10110 [Gemmatimonadetes bacterium]|nr:hypothetical protein [Gemmatimonadota bacterium]|tara:strand:+ start:929 stop:1321 length:393 start_codon:yes stop_codon:yes gene_type:complete
MLIWLLRIIGTTSALAILAVVMPYEWMNAIHVWLGMGTLPTEPIVGYLARTLSAFYAVYGALLWYLSFYTITHRPVIQFFGFVTAGFGGVLVGVDWVEGMPEFWKWIEGPFTILLGLLIVLLTREPEDTE